LPDYRLELGRHAASVLAPGERLLAAVRAMPVGPYGGSLGIFSGAVVGAIVQSVAISRSVKKALLSRFPMSGRMVIGITERRVLVWDRGGLIGRTTTKLVGHVPLSRLSGASIEQLRGRHKLTFWLRDAQAVTVEADGRDQPDRFAESLCRSLAESDSRPEFAAPALVAPEIAASAMAASPMATSAVATSAAPASTILADDEKSCPKCEARSPSSAEFCWRCYASFTKPSTPFSGFLGARQLPPPPVAQQAAGWPLMAKAGVAALVVVIAAVAVLALMGREEQSRIAMPDAIAGARRITSPQANQAESQIADLAERYGISGKAGFYGIEGLPTFAVVGFDYDVSEHESPEGFFQEFSSGVASANGNSTIDMTTFTNENQGETTYMCAQLSGELPGTVCMWSETDVVGFVLALRQGVRDARALTTTVRNAILS
jgi:hypothetical protein